MHCSTESGFVFRLLLYARPTARGVCGAYRFQRCLNIRFSEGFRLALKALL